MSSSADRATGYMQLVLCICVCGTILVCGALALRAARRSSHARTEPFDVCRGVLTDRAYLEHMIPHHQVAIDMSVWHQRHTTNERLAAIMRSLIWTQSYEIDLMQHMLHAPFANVSVMGCPRRRRFLATTFSSAPPNTAGLSTATCDPHFFDPAAHAAHMKRMGPITDRMYIDHMIPHHQVAVDMSKVLLRNTTNDAMSRLAYRIIRAQEAEIKLLHDLKMPPAWTRPRAVACGLL